MVPVYYEEEKTIKTALISKIMDSLFGVETDPKTTSENGSLKNHQVRGYKRAKPVLRPENVHFRIQKRCYKIWPNYALEPRKRAATSIVRSSKLAREGR